MASNVFAQADLSFGAGAPAASYSATQGQTTPVLIDFQIVNLAAAGTGDAANGVDLIINYDDVSFNYDDLNSSLASWTCLVSGGGIMTCSSPGAVAGGSTTNLNLAFSLNGTVAAANYPITANLNDISGLETLTTNNSANTEIVVNAVVAPDFEFDGAYTASSYEGIVGANIPVVLDFRLLNPGGDSSSGVGVQYFYDSNFTYDVGSSSIPFGWLCNDDVNNFTLDCSTSELVLSNSNTDFQIAFLPNIGITQGNYPFSATAADLGSSEINVNNNSISTNINMVDVQTDIELLKYAKDGPGTANLITESLLGASFYYQIHVNNLSTTIATNVTVTDQLPAGVQFLNDFSGGSWNCVVDPFVDEFTSQGVQCTHPGIPASSPNFGELIVLEVVGLNLGTKSNTAVASSDEADSNPSNNDNIASPANVLISNPVPDPDVSISKTILSGTAIGDLGDLEAVEGSQVIYKILAANITSGSDPAANVSISDTLPTGVTFSGFNPIGPNFSCQPFDTLNNKLVCDAASLPFTTADDGVEITVDVTGAVGTQVTNTAIVTADIDSNNANDSSSTQAFTIVTAGLPTVDLTMTKDAQDFNNNTISTVNVGDSFQYKLFVENFGSNDAPIGSVEVTDTLPPEVSFVTPVNNPPNWTCNVAGSNVSCVNDAIIPNTGAASVMLFPVIANAAATSVTNTASLRAVDPPQFTDTDIGNDTGAVSIEIIQGVADISFNKTVIGGVAINGTSGATNEFAIGDPVLYKLSATNSSTTLDYNDLVITDVLPTELVFDTVVPNSGFVCSYDNVSHKVTCNNDAATALAPGQQVGIDINMTANTSGLGITNIANISSQANAINLNSNSAIIDVDAGLSPTDLSVNKTAMISGSPVSSVTKGNAFTYRIDVNNTGNVQAENLQIIDTMPTGVVVNSSSGAGWNCSNIGQVYTCNLSNPLVAGATTFVDFQVIDNSVAGTVQLTNTAEVKADNTTSYMVTNTIDLTQIGFSADAMQNPDPVNQNSPFDIIVDVVNTGTEPLQGIQVVNTLPQGFSYNSPPANCTQNAQELTCTFASDVAVGTTDSLLIPVQSIAVSDTSATYVNTSVISGSNFPSTITKNLTLNVNSVSVEQANVEITKTASVSEIAVSNNFSYEIKVANIGSINASTLSVDDVLATGLVLNSIDAPDWSCTGTTQINCTQALLTPGTSSSIVLFVTAPDVAGTVTNSVSVSIAEQDSDQSNNTAQVDVNIVTDAVASEADIAIVKTASQSSLTSGESLEWTLQITNNGPIDALDLSISDSLPVGYVASAVNSDTAVCTMAGTVINCTLDVLANQASSTVTISGTVNLSSGSLQNSASVASSTNDPNTDNNTAQTSVEVLAIPLESADLAISKTASVQSVTSGEALEWTIEVVNRGPFTAANVVITDVLPNGFDVSEVSSNTSQCTIESSIITCTIGALESQVSSTIIVSGSVSLESGSLRNTATVTSDTFDPDVSNNSVESSVIVEAPHVNSADLAVSINSEASGSPGDTLNFEIVTTNNGEDEAQQPDLSVTVQGNIEEVSITENADWSCQIALQSINCQLTNETMPNGFQSVLLVSVLTSEQIQENHNIVVSATVSSTTEDAVLSNNKATFTARVVAVPTRGEMQSAMQNALAGRGNQQISRAIQNVSSYCERKYSTALEGLCNDIYQTALSGDGETIERLMKQITPNEVIGQSSSVAEIATAQFRNVGARLSQLRSGGGSGFSTAGLNARYGNGAIPLGMLSYLNQDEEEANGPININNDFISPWGFFVNGTVSMGKRDATGRELGFDFDTFGLTAGFDYRLSSSKAIGVAIGYANFDSQIDNNTANLKSTGVTLTAYGSFYVNDNFYVDTRISYGRPEFEQSREIDFSIGNINVNRTAVGKTNGNQYTVAMSAGYNFNKNAWIITPNASFRYVETKIDAFTESGAGDFNFAYSNQAIESLLWSAGIRMSKAISLKKGVITPQFDFDYNYESLNDGIDIEARFIRAPDDEVFIIETDAPDRTYGSAGLGFVYISANGKQAYINYRSVLGLEGFSRGTFNLGARFEF